MILIETNDATIRIDGDDISIDTPASLADREVVQGLRSIQTTGGVSKTIRTMVQPSADRTDNEPFAFSGPPFGDLSQNTGLTVCAKDIMQRQVLWANPDDSVQQALAKMQQAESGYMMVGKDGVIEGILSESDLSGAVSPFLRPEFAKWRRPLDDATLQIRVKWVMSRLVRTISPQTSLAAILENMCRSGGYCLPVVDQHGKVQGLVTAFNILKAFETANEPLSRQFEDELTEGQRADGFLAHQSAEPTSPVEQPQPNTAEHQHSEQATDLAEQASEATAVFDFDGTLRSANAAWAEIHGYKTKNELIGKHISVFHTEEQMNNDVAPFIEETKRRGRLTGPVEHLRADGTVFPTQMKMTVVEDQKGKVAALVVFATDITEYKQTERHLRGQTAELTDVNKQLQQEITERKQAEEHLRQQADELTAANQQLQKKIAECQCAENQLQQYPSPLEQHFEDRTTQLAQANQKLQQEITQCTQAEQGLERQADELIATNQQLQQAITERDSAMNQLQQYRSELEQCLQQQAAELATVNDKLQQEIAQRRRAEKMLRKIKLRLLTLTKGKSILPPGWPGSQPLSSASDSKPASEPAPSPTEPQLSSTP